MSAWARRSPPGAKKIEQSLIKEDGLEYGRPLDKGVYFKENNNLHHLCMTADKGLCAVLFHQGQARPCAECGTMFVSRSNRGNTATGAPPSCSVGRKPPMNESAAGVDI